jgi:hypothetical protein
MKPVTIDEILDIARYEKRRPELRPRAIELKARRRTPVGDHLTLLWENRDTAWYQIQEMLRIERIVDEDAIRHEIATYNELVPGDRELKATLLVEFPDPAERARRLRELVGLERHLRLRIGDAHVAHAAFDRRQIDEGKISSVQFVTFTLSPEAAAALAAGAAAVVEVDHPALRASGAIAPATLAELRSDLAAA